MRRFAQASAAPTTSLPRASRRDRRGTPDAACASPRPGLAWRPSNCPRRPRASRRRPAARRPPRYRRAGRQAEVLRQAQRDAGAGGDQRQVGAGGADGHQVGVGHRVDDGEIPALLAQHPRSARGSPAAPVHRGGIDQTDLALDLLLQHAHQVGIGHRRQRMIAHARLGEQHVADEQMALVDGAAVGRERRAGDGEVVPSASISASATGPMLPLGVESKVEQYLK